LLAFTPTEKSHHEKILAAENISAVLIGILRHAIPSTRKIFLIPEAVRLFLQRLAQTVQTTDLYLPYNL
jgi:hypothetical protein